MKVEEFEERLKNNLTIDKEMLQVMDSVYEEDSASGMNWLSGRIQSIANMLDAKKRIQILDSEKTVISSLYELNLWVKKRFPSI